jgi:RND family efflux transporter MFP subunit
MEKARSQEAIRSAEVVRVTRRDIGAAVNATGVIKPMVGAQVDVGSSASGVVTHLYVGIGNRVQKGQLLAMLDSRELVARRDADIAALQLARANLNYAQTDLRRKQELNAAQLIAPSVLDVATQAYAVAEQQCNQAQANLQDATTQLGYTQIFAPISGVVSAVSTQEGETATAGFATPNFVTLLDLSRLEVWAYVDEMDIGRIRIGHKGVLALPLRAVRSERGHQFVACRHGGANERRWVSTGMRDDSYWEITSGLQEGEEVVVGNPKTQ